jgi:hypothetical protein
MTGKAIPNEIKARRGTLRVDRVLSPSLKGFLVQGDIPDPPERLGELSQMWDEE